MVGRRQGRDSVTRIRLDGHDTKAISIMEGVPE